MISQEAKDALDLRLAKGEISPEKYTQTLAVMSLSEKRDTAVFSLLSKGELLEMHEDSFFWRGTRHSYNSIRALSFSTEKNTINFLPITRAVYLAFDIEGIPDRVAIGEHGGLMPLKNKPAFERAYAILADKSWGSRTGTYLGVIKYGSGIHIDGATFTRDGFVEKKGIRVNLVQAAAEGGILWGTMIEEGFVTMGGKTTEFNPHGCIIRTKNPRLQISFSASWDHDVLPTIIDALSKGPM